MSYTRPAELPSYKLPPVVEVAVGLEFEVIGAWNSSIPGIFSAALGADYSKITDQPPILSPDPAELANLMGGYQGLLTRTWFEKENQNDLVQLQNGRIHFNWRKKRPEDVYPRFAYMLNRFAQAFGALVQTLDGIGEAPRVRSGEVLYANQVKLGETWQQGESVNSVFSDLLGSKASEAQSIALDMELPPLDNGSAMSLNLGVITEQDVRTLNFHYIVRGRPASALHTGLIDWFGQANSAVVHRFTKMTTQRAHNAWGLER